MIGCYGRGGNGQVTGSSGCDAVTHCFSPDQEDCKRRGFWSFGFPFGMNVGICAKCC